MPYIKDKLKQEVNSMKKVLISPIVLISVFVVFAFGCEPEEPQEVVAYVEVERYMGKWYEIARYPNSFQSGCCSSTAEYSLRDDGRVDVINRCINCETGEEEQQAGVARVVDPETNAKLKVTFFWPFSGDYWIIQLSEDYSYAVVGHPKREFLWILSRTPEMDGTVYDEITRKLIVQGYNPEKLIRQ